MRLVGPNCLGVLNTDPAVSLDASFAPGDPPPGGVAFLSQSGALGIAVIDAVRELGLGLSSFVSIGDKADLSGNDFLAYWERDPGTDVILLYLESFGNPRKFSRVARRVARRKPIVAVKGGRSAAGAHAAGSHTGALLAASDSTVQALFEQAGVIPTDTLGELFDVATLLSAQPAPRGRRVGILSNGGGLGILCADACAAAGLEVVALGAGLRRELRGELLAGAALGNPIDLLAAASPDHFERTVRALARSGEVDAVIAIYVPPMVSEPPEVAAAVRRAAGAGGVPVVAVMAMADPPLDALADGALRVPAFRFPENAARAVARAARYGAWLEAGEEAAPAVEADALGAASVLATALERGPGWLEPAEVAALLDAYRIPRPAQLDAGDPEAAAAAARALGGPVALKAVAPGLVHRTDAGAVTPGLRTPAEVRAEAEAMAARVRAGGRDATGFVVQRMAPAHGVEMLAGVVADPVFGPVVACAAGGTAAEVLGDSAVRLGPLTRRGAAEMLRSLRTFALLDGFRGAPRCDVASLEELLLRLSALAEAHPEVAEVECNPAIVGPEGTLAVDARVRVQPPRSARPEPALPPT
jgi:acyl-CoA synthetase (NDP forming)